MMWSHGFRKSGDLSKLSPNLQTSCKKKYNGGILQVK